MYVSLVTYIYISSNISLCCWRRYSLISHGYDNYFNSQVLLDPRSRVYWPRYQGDFKVDIQDSVGHLLHNNK